MPTLEQFKKNPKKYLKMLNAYQKEEEEPEETQEEDSEETQEEEEEKPTKKSTKKSKTEKQLEKQILAKNKQIEKNEGFLKKLLKFANSRGEEEEEEKEEKEEKSNKMSKKETEKMLKLEKEVMSMRMDRQMDDLDVPRSTKARKIFLALVNQKRKETGEDLDAEELEEIVNEVKDFTEMKSKKVKKSKDSEEEEDEEEDEKNPRIAVLEAELRMLKSGEKKKKPGGTGKRLKGHKSKVSSLDEQHDVEAFKNLGHSDRTLLKEKNPEMYKTLNEKMMKADFWEVYEESVPYFGKIL